MTQKEILLHDEFDNPTGEFPNYDTYDDAQRAQLAKQKHIDLRSFYGDAILASLTMFNLDFLNMGSMDSKTMGNLEGSVDVQVGEFWTAGAVAKQADRNNWHGISLTCPGGTTTTTSSVLQTAS